MNPLAMILLPFVAYALAFQALAARRGRGLPGVRFPVWSGWMLLGVMLAYWVLRNVPAYPFTLLAPHT
jgi:hypothetical protein